MWVYESRERRGDVIVQINFSEHAIRRYQERVWPALDLQACERRLRDSVSSARLAGSAKGGTRKVQFPDCVLICKADGPNRWIARTCYGLPPEQEEDLSGVSQAPERDLAIGKILSTEDYRIEKCEALGKAVIEVTNLDETQLITLSAQVDAALRGEVYHRERLDFYLKVPERLASVDPDDRQVMEGARTSSGRRMLLLQGYQSKTNAQLRAVRHLANMARERERRVVYFATRFCENPTPENEATLRKAVSALKE